MMPFRWIRRTVLRMPRRPRTASMTAHQMGSDTMRTPSKSKKTASNLFAVAASAATLAFLRFDDGKDLGGSYTELLPPDRPPDAGDSPRQSPVPADQFDAASAVED